MTVHAPETSNSPQSEARVISLPSANFAEAELVAQVIAGRPAALRELFDRYAPDARRVVSRMIGPDAEVDDLVQEVMITVVRRVKTLRDPSVLRSYVISVAFRLSANERRRRAVRKKWLPWIKDAAPRFTAPHDIVGADIVRRVYEVLETLDANLQIAFVLRCVEGHELVDGARLAGCSLSTFKRRVQRARERFDQLASSDAVLAEWLLQGESQ